MILIIAPEFDFFTSNVIHWLRSLNVTDIVLINPNSELQVECVNLLEQKIIIDINSKKINFSDISFFWYRGGMLPVPVFDWQTTDEKVSLQVKKFINYEWKVLCDFLFYMLQYKKHIGNYFLAETNKLQNIHIAKLCGFSVPATYIAQHNFREKLNQEYETYIVKPIGESMPFVIDNIAYRLYTNEIDEGYLENNTQLHFPSLLQNKIDVDFEIRVFVLYEFHEFYSMAIFPFQQDVSCDYRKTVCTNRYAPYDLPENIRQKLLLFMEKTGLDTASFDLIKTKNGAFIFLEVNPFGNIDMINEICGYGIDKRFAEIIYDKYR